MPSPEPQNEVALPPLSEWSLTGTEIGKLRKRSEERERQLLSRMQALARIHEIAIDATVSSAPRNEHAVLREIVRLSDPNATK